MPFLDLIRTTQVIYRNVSGPTLLTSHESFLRPFSTLSRQVQCVISLAKYLCSSFRSLPFSTRRLWRCDLPVLCALTGSIDRACTIANGRNSRPMQFTSRGRGLWPIIESNQLLVPYLLNPFQTASASTPHDGRVVLYRNGDNGFTQNACIAQSQPQYARANNGEIDRSTRKPNQPRYDIDILIVAEIGFVYLLVQAAEKTCTYTLRDITKEPSKSSR
jgi:hypothetical protein